MSKSDYVRFCKEVFGTDRTESDYRPKAPFSPDKPQQDTPHMRKNLCRALAKHLSGLWWDYTVTLVFNHNHSPAYVREQVKRWHCHIDRELFGSKFFEKHWRSRTFFVAFFEHVDSNVHLHLILRLPSPKPNTAFKELAHSIWMKIVPAGDVHIRRVRTRSGKKSGVGYITKDQREELLYNSFIISSEFSPV